MIDYPRNKELSRDLFMVLRKYIKETKGIKIKDWAKCIKVTPGELSWCFGIKDHRIHLAEDIFKETIKFYNLEVTLTADNAYQISEQAEKVEGEKLTKVDKKNIYNSDTKSHAGLYKGFYIRANSESLVEAVLLLDTNGRAYFKTHPDNDSSRKYEGDMLLLKANNILFSEFIEENGLYHYVLTLKPSGSTKLVGILSGFGKHSDYKPLAAQIKFNLIKRWDEKSALTVFDDYQNEATRSFSLKEKGDINWLAENRSEDLLFVLGLEHRDGMEMGHTDLLFENVNFFKKIGLVPDYNHNAKKIAGAYICYRMSSSQNFLLARPVLISADGRVEMSVKRDSITTLYQGRAHLLDTSGGYLAFSMHRREEDEASCIHRTHYMFKAIPQAARKDIKYLFGKSCILSFRQGIRIGDEVLVPTDMPFEKLETREYDIRVPNVLASLSDAEKKIFGYLRKGFISIISEHSSGNKFPKHEEDLSQLYLKAASFEAEHGDKKEIELLLSKAYKHGLTYLEFTEIIPDNHLLYQQKEVLDRVFNND
jgi:hypothetical protein